MQVTWHSSKTRYPVMVFIHGGEFLHGSAEIYPGHVLATQGIAVVTFNYRLGALGKYHNIIILIAYGAE